jgi:hypothetical protein
LAWDPEGVTTGAVVSFSFIEMLFQKEEEKRYGSSHMLFAELN